MKKSKLIQEQGEVGNYVLLHGFGSMALTSRVGTIVEKNDNVIIVKSIDDIGEMQESFSVQSGIRIQDIGQEAGWMINLKDFDDGKLESAENFLYKKTKVTELSTVLDSGDIVICQIWNSVAEDHSKKSYIKTFRRVSVSKDGKSVIKELPTFLNLDLVQRAVNDYLIKTKGMYSNG